MIYQPSASENVDGYTKMAIAALNKIYRFNNHEATRQLWLMFVNSLDGLDHLHTPTTSERGIVL